MTFPGFFYFESKILVSILSTLPPNDQDCADFLFSFHRNEIKLKFRFKKYLLIFKRWLAEAFRAFAPQFENVFARQNSSLLRFSISELFPPISYIWPETLQLTSFRWWRWMYFNFYATRKSFVLTPPTTTTTTFLKYRLFLKCIL